tara:strand:+ start:343 stop:663 length:321 start_codon:yes stop_codon:yes gene_type:complete
MDFEQDEKNNQKSFVLSISIDEQSNVLIESEAPRECSKILAENSANLLYCLDSGQLKNLIVESITKIKDGSLKGLSGISILKEWAIIEESQESVPKISPKSVFGKS